MYYSPAYDRDKLCYVCGSVTAAECECTLEIEEALSEEALSEYTNGDYTNLSWRQRFDQLKYWHAMNAYNGRSEE